MHIVTSMTVLLLVAAAAHAGEDNHGVLRHRNLACIKKGVYCAPYPENCCGGTACKGPNLTCCIPEYVRGCDVPEDCCPLADDNVTPLDCMDSLCVGVSVNDTEDPRDCAIHGEDCNTTDPSLPGTCCGDEKYLCQVVSISVDDDDTKCCMEVGSKGCSYDHHCCGESEGNFCNESRCVYENGTYPGDSEGTRDCGLKGDPCNNVTDCCGDTKYECQEVMGATNKTCCLKSNVNGCGEDADCCDEHCELALALCCIGNGVACVHDESFKCCTGYCNPTTSVCDTLRR